MRPELTPTAVFIKTLPALALAATFLFLYVRPGRQELAQLSEKQASQAAGVAVLETRRSEVEHELHELQTRADQLQHADAIPSGMEVSRAMRRGTPAETFSVVLAAFEDHGVSCTRSDPTVAEALSPPGTIAYTLHLVGAFTDMCQALEHIKETVPNASPASLTMSRSPEADCAWEIVWVFESENL